MFWVIVLASQKFAAKRITAFLSMRPFFASYGKKGFSYRGAYRRTLCLSAVYCVSVTFVVFTDCESCTRPISTNPGSVKAGEYGLTRVTCFIARHLEVVAVAGLLWFSWFVLGAAGFRRRGFRFYCCFFERTRPAASMRSPCLIYLSTSNEASDRGLFLFIGPKSLFIRGCVQGCIIKLSVCLSI